MVGLLCSSLGEKNEEHTATISLPGRWFAVTEALASGSHILSNKSIVIQNMHKDE